MNYINVYSPYRGLLLYHGLGTGKTCSSIAIAEGLKLKKEIVVLTPASLIMNYREQLKSCGDILYKKKQKWGFDKITNKWVMSIQGKQYDELSIDYRKTLDKQINDLID